MPIISLRLDVGHQGCPQRPGAWFRAPGFFHERDRVLSASCGLLQYRFKSGDGGAVPVKPMLIHPDSLLDSLPPLDIPCQPNRDGHHVVAIRRHGFGYAHHGQNRQAMASAHERAGQGDDGQVMGESFEG